jgi:hypothetical protein
MAFDTMMTPSTHHCKVGHNGTPTHDAKLGTRKASGEKNEKEGGDDDVLAFVRSASSVPTAGPTAA